MKNRLKAWKSTITGLIGSVLTVSYPYFVGKDLSSLTWEQIGLALIIGVIGALSKW